MFELLTNVATGGLTGLLGSIGATLIGAWKAKKNHEYELEARRLDHEHDREMRRFDIAEMEAEAKRVDKQMAHETVLAREEAHTEGMLASYKEAGRALYRGESKLLRIADFVRVLVRPTALTIVAGFTIAIYFSSAANSEIREQITATILYLLTMMFVWYFNGRHIEKAEKTTTPAGRREGV